MGTDPNTTCRPHSAGVGKNWDMGILGLRDRGTRDRIQTAAYRGCRLSQSPMSQSPSVPDQRPSRLPSAAWTSLDARTISDMLGTWNVTVPDPPLPCQASGSTDAWIESISSLAFACVCW